ncbi:MAG: hypothetical protein A2017_08035 [Lentisphaerae bacterium GWF2_44_16]|nr:MAG: hypothetical protein A2017_08035 [Lentisphaerae bacterium GWF2_44_16]
MKSNTCALMISLFLGLSGISLYSNNEKFDIIPFPREIKLTGTNVDISKCAIVCADKTEQYMIAAAEINMKIRELGGAELPVFSEKEFSSQRSSFSSVIIICLDKNKNILSSFGAEKIQNVPQTQGYVIDFVTNEKQNIFVLAGHDSIGMMYAAITFRSLIKSNEKGIYIIACTIRDWPDFQYRHVGRRQPVPYNGETVFDAHRKYIDWLFRHKINYIKFDAQLPRTDSFKISAYAKARGMKISFPVPSEWGKSLFSVGKAGNPDDDKIFKDRIKAKGDYFCWSEDEILKKRALRLAEYMKAVGANSFMLHAVDGGGVLDPELWSLRCDKCRKRFGDDRATADANIFNIVAQTVREHIPDVDVELVVYPYGASYWDYETMKKGHPALTKETWEKNIIRYQKKLSPLLPKNAYVVLWLGTRDATELVMKGYNEGRQPLCIYFEYINPGFLGYLCTSVRYVGTNFFQGTPQIILTAGNKNFNPVQELLDAQFYWNTKTPGCEEYRGGIYSHASSGEYYDILKDDKEPEIIVKNIVPSICKNLWGEKNGVKLAGLFTSGLNPLLVADTGKVLSRINRARRSAGLENLEMSTSMMKEQFTAASSARKSIEGIETSENAFKNEDWSERFIPDYYAEINFLETIAGLRYYLLSASDLRNKNDNPGALKIINSAIEFMKKAEKEIENSKKLKTCSVNKDAYLKDIEVYKKAILDFGKKIASEKSISIAPRVIDGKIKVAIYNATGDKGRSSGYLKIKEILDGEKDFQVEYIKDLSISKLTEYDCLIFPQSILGASTGKDDYFNSISRFVNDGGRGVIFYHDACAYLRGEFGEKAVFPEICAKGTYGGWKNNKYIVSATHPSIKGYEEGSVHSHVYDDHILITPGKDGTIIMKDKNGEAVVVAGKAGNGRVIYDGTIIYPDKEDTVITEFDRKRLINSILWLAGK